MAPTTALGSPGLACVRKEVGHGGTDQDCTSRKKAESAVEAVEVGLERWPLASAKALREMVHFRAAILIPN